jgi:hypothetical protein
MGENSTSHLKLPLCSLLIPFLRVASEWLFAVVGDVVRLRRQTLLLTNAEMFVLLYKNKIMLDVLQHNVLHVCVQLTVHHLHVLI